MPSEAPDISNMAAFERLVRVETKLDALLLSKADAHAEISHDISDHEVRIRALETVRWKVAGVTGLVAALAATVFSAVVTRLISGN